MIQTVVKRDGRIVGFNEQKIMAAIRKAMLHTDKGEDERDHFRRDDQLEHRSAFFVDVIPSELISDLHHTRDNKDRRQSLGESRHRINDIAQAVMEDNDRDDRKSDTDDQKHKRRLEILVIIPRVEIADQIHDERDDHQNAKRRAKQDGADESAH